MHGFFDLCGFARDLFLMFLHGWHSFCVDETQGEKWQKERKGCNLKRKCSESSEECRVIMTTSFIWVLFHNTDSAWGFKTGFKGKLTFFKFTSICCFSQSYVSVVSYINKQLSTDSHSTFTCTYRNSNYSLSLTIITDLKGIYCLHLFMVVIESNWSFRIHSNQVR